MSRQRILIVFGTRPEAIKLFPVVQALAVSPHVDVQTCVTAQHRGLLDQVLAIADIVADHDLNLMESNQSLDRLTARSLLGIGEILDGGGFDRVVVQGDTATAMTATLAAYYRKLPVAHVEAGLRSGNIYHPWPEEVNRRMISPIADLHFAPTDTAARALYAEGVVKGVHVTGNTVIDALHSTLRAIEQEPARARGFDQVRARVGDRRVVLVTTHRRENFGAGMASIATAIGRIAEDPNLAVVFPVHPNPSVVSVMETVLGKHSNVIRVDPLDYPSFVSALSMATMVLTDSGGLQEEAPALGKPVLVMRETTERPEGVAAGTARLVGTNVDQIVANVRELLDDDAAYQAMARAHNPFGDGRAAERIAQIIVETARAA